MAASTKAPLVTALIVSYNVRDLLVDALRAFYATTDVPVEAVVVDNASRDGSADAVASEFPDVKLVRLPKNAGFGAANNAGLKEATGRFVLLMNPDVTVDPNCVGRLADFLLVRPDVGALGPRITRPDGSLDFAARRSFPSPSVAFYRVVGLSRLFPKSPRFGRYNMGHISADKPHEMDAGTAACLMVRRAAIDRVGFFDPDFFMYGEDLDLCYRLKRGGWKIYYLPSALAVHVKGAATEQATQRMLYQFHRAMWTFHHKHNAEAMSAFGNGLVWAAIWGRWAALAAKARITNNSRVSP
jgi:GT2 family glycosyltransferase